MPDINLGELTLGDSKVLAAQERVTKGFGEITSKITDLAAVEEAASRVIVKSLNDEKRVLEALIKKRAELGEVARGTLDAEIKASAAKVSALQEQVKGTDKADDSTKKLTKTTTEYDRQVSKLQNRLRGLVTGFALAFGAAALGAIIKFGQELFGASENAKRLKEAMDGYAKAVGKATAENNTLFDKLRRLNPESELYKVTLEEINKRLTGYKDLKVGATLDETFVAQRQLNKETQIALRLQALTTLSQQAQAEVIEAEINFRAERTVFTIAALGKARQFQEAANETLKEELALLAVKGDQKEEEILAEQNSAAAIKKFEENLDRFRKKLEESRGTTKETTMQFEKMEDSIQKLTAPELVTKIAELQEQLAGNRNLLQVIALNAELSLMKKRLDDLTPDGGFRIPIPKDGFGPMGDPDEFHDKQIQQAEEMLALREREVQANKNLMHSAFDLAGALSALLESQAGENEKFAEFQKALALFQIAVNTASAVSSAIKGAAGLPFPANLAAIAGSVAAVLGAIAQAKAILSDSGDVPKFAKGTERFKGGLAMVGEKGKELVFLPPNSAIANNQATTKYTKQIKAMNEGKWEQLITEMYLRPALQGLTNQFNNELAKVIHKEHDTDRRQGAMNTGLLRKALRRHYNPRD